jgi:hypothetical protein
MLAANVVGRMCEHRVASVAAFETHCEVGRELPQVIEAVSALGDGHSILQYAVHNVGPYLADGIRSVSYELAPIVCEERGIFLVARDLGEVVTDKLNQLWGPAADRSCGSWDGS